MCNTLFIACHLCSKPLLKNIPSSSYLKNKISTTILFLIRQWRKGNIYFYCQTSILSKLFFTLRIYEKVILTKNKK